tara:strand:- start:645 stop:1409 length:765 start_codon:yes stop_codon:yes gene_type:complete
MENDTPKPRSPRFPFIPLEEAIKHLHKLNAVQSDASRPMKRPEMLKALDYGSFHGAAIKTIAALRAYDLLEKREDGVAVSAVGRGILDSRSEEETLDLRQRAALSPLMFRRIWRRARHCSRGELKEQLLERGFTEPGAKRASKIYRQNSEYAALQVLELEPELPERGPKRAKIREAGSKDLLQRKPGNRGGRRSVSPDSLVLPLSTGSAIIPKGITKSEFAKLMQTLKTCRALIVDSEAGEESVPAAASPEREG